MVAVEGSLAQRRWGIDTRDAVVDGQPVVLLSGDIDGFNAHRLTAVMMSYCRHEQLILDLGGVRRLASAGLDAMIACAWALSTAGCNLVLQNPSKTVEAVLDATGNGSRFLIRHIASNPMSLSGQHERTDASREAS